MRPALSQEEAERLERQLEVKSDVVARGLVQLVTGKADVLVLPGGWRVRMDARPRSEER